MKLSCNWLKQYIKIDESVKNIAKALTMSGSEVGEVVSYKDDSIMELEITANRPDCLNVLGLAREVGTIFNKDLLMPEFTIPKQKIHKKGPEITCLIENDLLCSYYSGRVICGVNVKGVNSKIKDRILSVGMRDVNNVVDITNFCLLETGQPLHAFDLDKIEGNEIIVREAVKGEKIVTIDGVERVLQPPMLVIADTKRPIAIAGVIGGKLTEVTSRTRNILLESAYFSPVSVRQTSRELGISTDSSYRFERAVDKGMVSLASDRAALLISRESGGEICSFFNAGTLTEKKKKIKFSIERAEKILGVKLKKTETERIFRRLEILEVSRPTMKRKGGSGPRAVNKTKTSVTVCPPSFRSDLNTEVDLIEEIARIYGYDNIPSGIAKFIPATRRKEKSRIVLEKISETCAGFGLNEIMTYSLISPQAAKLFTSGIEPGQPVTIEKALSEEQKVLTPQLLDGMLKSIAWNINRNNKNLGFFEIGKLYFRKNKKFLEIPALSCALTGLSRKNWKEGERTANFFDLKGMIESLCGILKVPVTFHVNKEAGFRYSASIETRKKTIGFIGEIDLNILNKYDIAQKVFACQIKLDEMISLSKLENRHIAVNRFPSSSRDVSVLCSSQTPAEDIRKLILKTGAELLLNVALVDMYEGKQVSSGKKSLTYSIEYGMRARTLTEEEIEAVHSKIKETLISELNVTFR